ncbi:MAG: hypothetical protein AMXMBFR13_37930 [Phycisphaerae bacterium]
MTSREKVLTGLVGGAVAVFLAKEVVYDGYVGLLADRSDTIIAREASLKKAKDEQKQAKDAYDDWLEIGTQTLSTEVNEAQAVLRDELVMLTHPNSGLSKVSIALSQKTRFGKNNLDVLAATVSGEGTLENVVKFLYRLHAQPYLVRVKSLVLSHPMDKDTPPNVLRMSARVETPLLPGLQKVPLALIKPVKLEDGHRPEEPRGELASVDDYHKAITKRKITQPWEPPMPLKASNPRPAPNQQLIEQTSVDLAFQPHPQAKAHNVYFGTQPNKLELIGELVDAHSIKRGDLVNGTYFWRVDETDAEGNVFQGDLWQFRITEKQIVQDTPPPPPPPPPPIPPAYPDHIVGRVLSWPGGQQVVLEVRPNPQSITAEVRLALGERLHDGTLVFVHPSGVVTEKDGQRRFHALGQPVKQLQPLTEKEFPDVYDELVKLERRVSGITGRPG